MNCNHSLTTTIFNYSDTFNLQHSLHFSLLKFIEDFLLYIFILGSNTFLLSKLMFEITSETMAPFFQTGDSESARLLIFCRSFKTYNEIYIINKKKVKALVCKIKLYYKYIFSLESFIFKAKTFFFYC